MFAYLNFYNYKTDRVNFPIFLLNFFEISKHFSSVFPENLFYINPKDCFSKFNNTLEVTGIYFS